MGPRGRQGGVDVGAALALHHPFCADQTFEGRRGRKVGVPQKQPHVQVGTGLELDPARLAVCARRREGAPAPGMRGGQLGGGPGAAAEARVESGQLGPCGAPGRLLPAAPALTALRAAARCRPSVE